VFHLANRTRTKNGLAGSRISAAADGGTSARVFGSFISWMAEKTAPVFVVATANEVSQLPPGRIQVAKHNRDPKDFDVVQLATATDGLTGSEIGAVVVEALYRAFDEDQEPTDLTIAEMLTDFVPLSKTKADQITGLWNWAKGRARFATSPQTERSLRKMAV
jgi:SpoVK/Ycf46/Vps4 family AAA+-type ATPase